MLDVESAEAAGLDLDRVLWIRGHVVTNPGMCRDMNQRALEQAIRAFTLVLQAGNFGVVVFDVADAPRDAIRRLPFTTWLRLQRLIEGSQTTGILVGSEAMARRSAGLTLQLGLRDAGLTSLTSGTGLRGLGMGIRFHGALFDGLDVEARVVRARARYQEQHDVRVPLSTACA